MGKTNLFDAVTQFVQFCKATCSKSTLKVYVHYLDRFKQWAGDIPLSSITPALVLTYSRKYHPLQAVQRLLSWCRREARLVSDNPLEGMRKVRRGRRQRILSRKERCDMLRGATSQFRHLALALIETLARPAEMRGATWHDVRTTGNQPMTLALLRSGHAFFMIPKFKAQDWRRDLYAVRVIPITPRLGRLLARLWGHGHDLTQEIFRNTRGKAWTVNAVRCQVRRLRVNVALAVGQGGEKVVAYSFRHSGATEAIMAGVKDAMLAEIMGHSDPRMTMRYVHLQPDHLTEVMRQFAADRKHKK